MKRFNTYRNLAISVMFAAVTSTSAMANDFSNKDVVGNALNESISIQLEQLRDQIALASQIDVLDDVVNSMALVAPEANQEIEFAQQDEELVALVEGDVSAEWVTQE